MTPKEAVKADMGPLKVPNAVSYFWIYKTPDRILPFYVGGAPPFL